MTATLPASKEAAALAVYFKTRDILTTDNYKMRKDSLAWLKVGLGLAPANESGFQTCPFRSPGCEAECLKFAGRNQGTHTGKARIMRTRLFFLDRPAFLVQFKRRLVNAMKRARKSGRKLAARFNIMSDQRWERIAPELFALVDQAYDYTKDPLRMAAFLKGRDWPANYHLTFSRSETNEATLMESPKDLERELLRIQATLDATEDAVQVVLDGYPEVLTLYYNPAQIETMAERLWRACYG